jgi:hypothetical protein
VPDGEQGRSWTLVRCTSCGMGMVDGGDDPSLWCCDDSPARLERVRVYEHPTDGEGADERKWTRAFTRLEKAVQRHRDAKGWTDDADDELHRVLEKVLRDVGPAPARARSDGEQGRSWTLWVCPECSVIEQDEPCMASMTCHREGHGGVPMERVRVYEHTTAEDRNRG